jgi:hypothetical protein
MLVCTGEQTADIKKALYLDISAGVNFKILHESLYLPGDEREICLEEFFGLPTYVHFNLVSEVLMQQFLFPDRRARPEHAEGRWLGFGGAKTHQGGCVYALSLNALVKGVVLLFPGLVDSPHGQRKQAPPSDRGQGKSTDGNRPRERVQRGPVWRYLPT